jgi:Tol biopolymer transport system component
MAAGGVLCLFAIYHFLLRTPPVRLNPNRTSATLRIPFKLFGYHSLSRDGNWVAFSARAENGTWDLYWMTTAGEKPIRLTAEEAHWLDDADISSDVSQIAFAQRRSSFVPFEVRIVAAHGGESRTLADTGCYPKWRPDGRRIGYYRTGNEGQYPSTSGKFEIWSVLPDGTDRRLELIDTTFTWGDSFAFCWSPDGGSITWVRTFPRGHAEIMVRDLATGKERQLTSDNKSVDEVIWTTNDQILFVSNRAGQDNLWMVPAGGGEPTELTTGGMPVVSARISADLKTLAYAYKEKMTDIWVSGADGSNPRQVTSEEIRIFDGRFSPDGRHIAYVVGDVTDFNKERHLHVMERDGTNRRQLTSGAETVTGSTWSTDGRWIAYCSLTLGDSAAVPKTYLLEPFHPAPPRFLCNGIPILWADSSSLFVFNNMKTFRYSRTGGSGAQFFLDSTVAIPLGRNRQVCFYDHRAGRTGLWVGSLDGRDSLEGAPKRILQSADDWTSPEDPRFFVFRRGNELWRLSTSTWKEERIGKVFQGSLVMHHMSSDGKEILWLKGASRSKMILVKDPFSLAMRVMDDSFSFGQLPYPHGCTPEERLAVRLIVP